MGWDLIKPLDCRHLTKQCLEQALLIWNAGHACSLTVTAGHFYVK